MMAAHAAHRGPTHEPVEGLAWFKARRKEGIAAGLLAPEASADGLRSLVRRRAEAIAARGL